MGRGSRGETVFIPILCACYATKHGVSGEMEAENSAFVVKLLVENVHGCGGVKWLLYMYYVFR